MKLIDINERARAVLEVNKLNNTNEIKKAYYKKAKDFHPDINNEDEIKMALIIEAYDWLNGKIKKETLLSNNKIMKELIGKDFDNEKSYQEWHMNQFYGNGVI